MAKLKFTRKVIGNIDCGKTALALSGFVPFGDCNSIRIRLEAAKAQLKQLTENADYLEKALPGDEYIALFRHEARVWEYAIKQGEALLLRELKKPEKR